MFEKVNSSHDHCHGQSSADQLREELLTLLGEDVLLVRHRQKTLFDTMVYPYQNSLVLVGAGSLGRKVMACLRHRGVEPLAFADNDQRKWGTKIDDLQVLSHRDAAERWGSKAAFVVTIASPGHSYLASRRVLQDLGCSRVAPVLPLLWKYNQELLPHLSYVVPHFLITNLRAIQSSFDLLEDNLSRKLYIDHLKLRLRADYDSLMEPQLTNQYFPEDVVALREDEVFVDAGAYDGDTIKALLRRSPCKHIYAFEPDPVNFETLESFVRGLRQELRAQITLVRAALGSRQMTIRFDASGSLGAAISAAGQVEAECLPLDVTPFADPPTFIKMDIEGAELDALQGARQIIAKHHPMLAVSVYHRPDDLWHIPNLLHSINTEYELFLRCHSYDGLDVVLYAVPKKRRRKTLMPSSSNSSSCH